jgi:hypothetical protein
LTEFELDAVVGGNGFKVSQVSIGNVAAQTLIGNTFAQAAVGWGAENEITIANNAGNINNAFNG